MQPVIVLIGLDRDPAPAIHSAQQSSAHLCFESRLRSVASPSLPWPRVREAAGGIGWDPFGAARARSACPVWMSQVTPQPISRWHRRRQIPLQSAAMACDHAAHPRSCLEHHVPRCHRLRRSGARAQATPTALTEDAPHPGQVAEAGKLRSGQPSRSAALAVAVGVLLSAGLLRVRRRSREPSWALPCSGVARSRRRRGQPQGRSGQSGAPAPLRSHAVAPPRQPAGARHRQPPAR